MTVVLGALLTEAVHMRFFEKRAVIVVGEAAVRHGPLAESKTAFTARDGTEVQVMDQLNGWWQIKEAGGRTGWVRASDALMLGGA